MPHHPLIQVLRRNVTSFHPVVAFNENKEQLVAMDFTAANTSLTETVVNDTNLFCNYIDTALKSAGALYGIGGYNELRTVYSRSNLFASNTANAEPRRLHLGTDIWGAVDTPVYAFLGGMVHSFAFNDNYGDYGATLILLHQLEAISFYTLYGHISIKDISTLVTGQYLNRGDCIAHFGTVKENGHWPPHLHFQVIADIELKEGDYPGVCKFSEREKYLDNCPDPDLILQLNQFMAK
jgi:peptidoglycan LD-endopeptidase LytH